MHIVWSPQSLRDLDAIHEYIAKDSERYADLTVSRIFAAVDDFSNFGLIPLRTIRPECGNWSSRSTSLSNSSK
jgi:plasmid stabilization system protein ParE